ncbi:hypothetical protein GQ53DRAFT_355915 [Thozetella sp. PMI_491]|nr:hypothetical protein GQ53DRAFT_355915 [Thozetella sp. PMI_491]
MMCLRWQAGPLRTRARRAQRRAPRSRLIAHPFSDHTKWADAGGNRSGRPEEAGRREKLRRDCGYIAKVATIRCEDAGLEARGELLERVCWREKAAPVSRQPLYPRPSLNGLEGRGMPDDPSLLSCSSDTASTRAGDADLIQKARVPPGHSCVALSRS